MAIKRGTEIPTIDVALLTISVDGGDEIALTTASKLGVEPQTQTQDAVKLVVKGRLIAQKHEDVTLTGNKLTLTDNVLTPEVVKILQGGTIKNWTDEQQTAEGDEDNGFGVARYTPSVAGSAEKGSIFITRAYSAIYDASGICTGYDCISYPNCKGTPIALNSEDGVFRAPEYTINSAPAKGQAPYELTYIKELPDIPEVSA